MSTDKQNENVVSQADATEKRLYEKPTLVEFGNVIELTRGTGTKPSEPVARKHS